MKNKGTRTIWDSKIFWAVVSLIAALALWSYITSTEGAVGTRIISGVPVEFNGEDALRDTKGLVVTDVDTHAVTITVSGPRSELSKIDEKSIRAVVDLTTVTGANTYIWNYDIIYPDKVDPSVMNITSRFPQSVSITVDKLSWTNVEVGGSFDGSLADNHKAGQLIFNPATIKVYGPETVVSKLSYAWVSFERDNVDSTLTLDVPFTLLDRDGNLVDQTNLELEQDTVTVTLPIQSIKEVPLTVDLVEGAGATAQNTIVEIEPSTVTLSGDSALLDVINKISIATIDLKRFESHYEDTYTIPIDNDLENLTGEITAHVTVDISGLATKELYVTNFECTHVTDGYQTEILTQRLKVVVRAEPDELQNITGNSLRAVADLAEFGAMTGTVTPTVKVYVDNKNAGVIGEYEINVRLSRK